LKINPLLQPKCFGFFVEYRRQSESTCDVAHTTDHSFFETPRGSKTSRVSYQTGFALQHLSQSQLILFVSSTIILLFPYCHPTTKPQPCTLLSLNPLCIVLFTTAGDHQADHHLRFTGLRVAMDHVMISTIHACCHG
jgi:hypothetical protein